MSARAFRAWAVVPAAGESVRMGRPKLLLPWNGQPMIAATIAAWRASGVDEVIVVVRAGGPAEITAAATAAGATVVAAAAPPDMKASISAGLRFIAEHRAPAAVDAWLVAPADIPALRPAAVQALLSAYDPSAPQVLAAVYGAAKGHPVLLPWALAAELARLGDDEGLNTLLARHAPRPVVTPGNAPADIDTPEDYRAELEKTS